MPKFSNKSLEILDGIDPKLQELFKEVVKNFDCAVLEGKGTPERQLILVNSGKSKTKYSKHIEGLAVDVAPYPIEWKNRDRFHYFAGYVKGIASQKGIKVIWGGDWDGNTQVKDNNFDDLVHYEIGGL